MRLAVAPAHTGLVTMKPPVLVILSVSVLERALDPQGQS